MNREYTLSEIKGFIEASSGIYKIVRLVDPEETRVLEISDDNLVYGNPCHDVWECVHRCANCSSFKACRSQKTVEKNELFRGNVYHVQSDPVLIIMPDGRHVNCVLELITYRPATEEDKREMLDKENSDDISSIYFHDPLTGLYNREGFEMAVRKELEDSNDKDGERRILIVTKIRQFRLLRDLFGVKRTNGILLEAAKYLKGHAVGYIEDGCFAVLTDFDEKEKNYVAGVPEKARKAVGESNFRINSVSGIYEITDKQLSVDSMIERAEMALHYVPQNDFDGVRYFNQAMMDELLYKQSLVGGFHSALAAEEFKMFIQPQVNEKGKVLGGEALARWIKSDGTVISPAKFIPVLEESGLIAEMDLAIWEQAVKRIKLWENTEFENLYISINISPLDFYYINVGESLKRLVEKYQINRRKLRLEITETAVMKDEEADLNVVNELKEYGFIVEIDDFGKGYSSLSMLKKIPADVLKIDMAFVNREGRGRGEESKVDEIVIKRIERGDTILSTIIELAKKLDMDVITEGVETKEEVESLKEKGCFMFQGYYFSRPVDIDKFEQFVLEKKRCLHNM